MVLYIHNLLIINQLCDKDFDVFFKSLYYIMTSSIDDSIILIRHRHKNVYMVDLNDHPMKNG